MRKTARQSNQAEVIFLFLLLVIASTLVLANLGNIYLWGDESHTAVLARTILTHGVPVVYDGRNYYSALPGKDYGNGYVFKWHPWFQFYVLAPFFAVFGTSTFVARLPFALIGIATIFLTYFFAKSLWRNRRAGMLSAIILMVSVPFLLLIRQCRYYSPEAFFSLLSLYGYHGILEGRKRSGLLFVLSSVLLFHTQFVQCAALMATVLTHALLFRRDMAKKVLIPSAIVVALILPWAIWFSGLHRDIPMYSSLTVRATMFTKSMVLKTFRHIFPPLILTIPVILLAADLIRRKRRPVESGTVGTLSLFVLFAFFTIVSSSLALPSVFFRYLVPLIPVACIVMGLIVESAMKVHPAVGVAAILLLAWWWRMPDYLYEITHDYDGPNEGISEYLNEHGSSSDIVVANHDDMPLKFYTKMRVVSMTTGEDPSPAKKANWVIMRRLVYNTEQPGQHYLHRSIPWDKYTAIAIPYPDIDFENREDPDLHHFRTVEGAGPVFIYHRIEQ